MTSIGGKVGIPETADLFCKTKQNENKITDYDGNQISSLLIADSPNQYLRCMIMSAENVTKAYTEEETKV